MSARSVLIDGGMLAAIVDLDDPLHVPAAAAYTAQFDDYAQGRLRLFARSDDLERYPRSVRRTTLAPVESAWVARQHRRAARSVQAPDPSTALTVTLLKRERFWGLMTLDPYFTQFDLNVLLVGVPSADGHGDGQTQSPDDTPTSGYAWSIPSDDAREQALDPAVDSAAGDVAVTRPHPVT